MALTKDRVVDRKEILEDGTIQVRIATVIKEDGVELTRTFHRHVINPSMEDITGEDAGVQAVAGVVWTQSVKDAYAAAQPA